MSTKKVLKLVKKTTNMNRKNFGSMRDLIKLKSAYEALKLKRNIKKSQEKAFNKNNKNNTEFTYENKLVCDEAKQIKFTKG